MRNRISVFLITLLSLSPIHCSQSDKPMSDPNSIKEYAENYNPGDEWNLVWSDEFDGDSLNMDN